MTIYQPRRENVSTWTIPVADLMEWTENTLVPKAALAFKGEGEYIPGSWCTFCRAAVGGLIVKPRGNPTLVPVSDKRPAINFTNATQDFNDFTERS